MDYFEELIQEIVLGHASTRNELLNLKAKLCRKHRLARVPANYEVLERVPEEYRDIVEPMLRNKPVRTMSGVAPVAVMTSPCDCPHGRCSYCPGGTANETPQSYTGQEPAALRASMYAYDPSRQTASRIAQLHAIGHRTDKVDLIVMGGTFTARSREYQDWFIKRCFDGMNEHESKDLESAQLANESARSRCVGLTVETRPDWFGPEQAEHALDQGATKVELGAQILDDEVLRGVDRGHDVSAVIDATRTAKDAGFKIAYHMMPGLPGADKDRDLESFRKMTQDERFKPDMLKIYPTLVVKGTRLYEDWAKGRYEPLTLDAATDLLARVKRQIPPWMRILRIQRDIPVKLIDAGIRKSHLRELVRTRLEESGDRCRCIRCREIGHRPGEAPKDSDVDMREISYRASAGEEMFMSYEIPSTDSLIGYARLRFPSPEGAAALLRELHIYGQMVPISKKGNAWQHRGFGEGLLAACEERASERGLTELRVTSGVGARNYYRRLGYERAGPYMSKRLSAR